MSTADDLARYARMMLNASPQAYADFCTAFHLYALRQYEAVVDASPETVAQAQGRAQQCKKILQVLEGVKHHG